MGGRDRGYLVLSMQHTILPARFPSRIEAIGILRQLACSVHGCSSSGIKVLALPQAFDPTVQILTTGFDRNLWEVSGFRLSKH